MDFFKKKIVKIIAWIVLALSAIVLILGGATAEAITNGVVLTAGIVVAVSGLIAFICEQAKK